MKNLLKKFLGISIVVGMVFVLAGAGFFVFKDESLLSAASALFGKQFLSKEAQDYNLETTKIEVERKAKIEAIHQSLPRFEDYPAEVYSIPPRPKLNRESNPYGMRYWTFIGDWVRQATEYDMAGHYLMDRYGTQNPRVLIIDGLTGRVFHEYGSWYPFSIADSSLVIFDAFDSECFTQEGDYEPAPCYNKENPRYAAWNGEYFETLCEPVIKNWKVVSCGGADDENSKFFKGRVVGWLGIVVSKAEDGRLRVKTEEDDLSVRQYGYSELIVEPYNEDGTSKKGELTADVKVGDKVGFVGFWIGSADGFPLVGVRQINIYSSQK